MSQRVVTHIELRDDLDGALGDDVQTRQFCWAKKDFEFELSDENHESFQADYQQACRIMEPWIKIARPAKRSKPTERQGIREFAAQYGINWHNESVRRSVRDWLVRNGYQVSGKRIPREMLETYIVQTGLERRK